MPIGAPIIIASVALIAASITDIQKREVPDLVSWGLVALGAALAAGTSLFTQSWSPIIAATIGLAVGYLIGAGLYYTGQWGGGDAKLLMGLGATLGIPLSWVVTLRNPLTAFTLESMPFLILFVLLLVFVGAAYGLVWLIALAIIKRKVFMPKFRAELRALKRWRILVLAITAVLVISSLLANQAVVRVMMILLAALVYVSFYLFISVRVVETQCMRKTIKVKDLTEGDWIVDPVLLKGKKVIDASASGITKEQLAVLKAKASKQLVTVKEGIPFVPSFLIAFIITLVL